MEIDFWKMAVNAKTKKKRSKTVKLVICTDTFVDFVSY